MDENGDSVECANCGTSVPAEDAVMLTHTESKGLWKYLCPSCLRELGVPRGYELDREVTHLQANYDSEGEAESEETATGRNRSVIADFQGQIVTAETPGGDMHQGRVVMNDSQLVLVTGDHRTQIALDSILDIQIEQASASTREYFDDVIHLTYGPRSNEKTAFIGASADVIENFASVLFKGVLNGETVRVKYPVVFNGLPKDPPPRTGLLRVADGSLRVERIPMPPEIDPQNVINITKRRREWSQSRTHVFEVAQREFGGITTAEFTFDSARVLNLVGRFIHTEYGDRVATLQLTPLAEPSLQVLTAIWTLETVELPDSIVADVDRPTREIVEDLFESEFLESADSAELTTLGLKAVFDRFEENTG